MRAIMKVRIKRLDNKEVLELFPAVLGEIRHNYRVFQQGLAELDGQELSAEDEAELAAARKYAHSVRVAWRLGQNTWKMLEAQNLPIDDENPALPLLVGVSSYATNRFRELRRTEKSSSHSNYIVRKLNGTVDIVGGLFPKDKTARLEDLSYIYYGRPNRLEITDHVIRGFDVGVSKLLDQRMKDQATIKSLTLHDAEQKKFEDLENRLQLIWYMTRKLEIFEHIMECLRSDDSPEIYQCFCEAVAGFLENVAIEYKVFRTYYKLGE